MIRIRQIKINLDSKQDIKDKVSKILHININEIKSLKINKKSLDARKKDNLFYVYEVDIEVENEKKLLRKYKSTDIFETPNEEYIFPS